ncbi:hypothetical protein Tco_0015042 [Tanacetum coccineum]
MSGISCSTIKVNRIYNFEKVLKMLDWVFGHKFMECTSVLHQPDGVGSQGGHLGSFRKLNGISVALVARLRLPNAVILIVCLIKALAYFIFITEVHTKKGTKPGEPGSSGFPEFVDPMSKQRLDEYSKIISEKHVENEENTEIDENGSKSPPDDFEVWKGVATSNRGHVLGVGLTTDPAFVLTEKIEDDRVAAEAHRVVDQLALHKTLNDRLESFAKNYPPRAIESDRGPS